MYVFTCEISESLSLIQIETKHLFKKKNPNDNFIHTLKTNLATQILYIQLASQHPNEVHKEMKE